MSGTSWPAVLSELAESCPAPGVGIQLVTADGLAARVIRGYANVLTSEAVSEEHYWDLASLTKVMVTLPAVMDAIGLGLASLSDPLGDVWPRVRSTPYEGVTLAELLSHSSGAPATADLRPLAGAGTDALLDELLRLPRERRPPGFARYSDVGMMLAGLVAEHLTGRSLAAHAAASGWAVYPPLTGPVVATEVCPWRGRLLQGEVHDENASVFPGATAGHAGAFAQLGQIADYLAACLKGTLFHGVATEVATRPWTAKGSDILFGLGFRLGELYSSGGSRAAAAGFGATGFVGNLLWVEPHRRFAVAAVTNRVHPSRTDRAVFDAWGSRLIEATAAVQST